MRACCPLAFLSLALALGYVAADDKPKPEAPAKGDGDKNRELHVVGISEGYTKTDGKLHGGKAQVLVSRPDKTVTLVLVSYSPVTWEVAVGKNTTVEKVILGGSGKAAVKGTLDKVEVVEAFRGSKSAKLPFYAYQVDTPTFPKLVEAIDDLTNQKIASFMGQYRAEADVAFTVDSVSDDERLSVDYPMPAKNLKLPKLTFSAHHEVPGERSYEVTRSFGEFTLSGPKADALRPLPEHTNRIVYDPAGKKYYGITSHELAEIDLDKKKVTKIDTDLNVPKLSWPSDVTFDTKRERVLLAGSRDLLYAYYPKTAKWEVLAEKAPGVIVYHPKDETVYGLKSDLGGQKLPELQQIGANGAVVTSVKLDGPLLSSMFGRGPGANGVQLVAADDKLVLLINGAVARGGEASPLKWSYIYLLDQKTGKAQLVWKRKVVK